MTNTATVETLRNILGNGKFATITFEKLDGSIRKLNGRVGVSKGVKGNGNTSPYVVKVYDVQKDANGNVKGWRTVKPEKVMEIVANKQIYSFIKGESEPSFITDVKSVGDGVLRVAMGKNDVYFYFGVPILTSMRFKNASSKGRFFNEHIKGKFVYTKVR
jgi:hypothetical protein